MTGEPTLPHPDAAETVRAAAADVPADRAALVVMVGPPGSGKSTWCASRFGAAQRFSTDMFRRVLCGDPLDMDATPEAVVMLDSAVGFRMRRRLTTVVDATNVVPQHRAPLLAFAHAAQVPAVAVVMHTPLQVCIDRQASRTPAYADANAGAVPPEVITEMWEHMRLRPPTCGLRQFNAIVHVSPLGEEAIRVGELPPDVANEPWLAGVTKLRRQTLSSVPWVDPSLVREPQ